MRLPFISLELEIPILHRNVKNPTLAQNARMGHPRRRAPSKDKTRKGRPPAHFFGGSAFDHATGAIDEARIAATQSSRLAVGLATTAGATRAMGYSQDASSFRAAAQAVGKYGPRVGNVLANELLGKVALGVGTVTAAAQFNTCVNSGGQ